MNEEEKRLSRARCVFSGMVQGVGFRFTAEIIARGFAVAGYVRNLPDGGVEIEVEGERSEVANFIAAVEERMKRYIRRKGVQWLEYTGGLKGFDIRF
jgi:acylphosphatase